MVKMICGHCGRICCDYDGGWGWAQDENLCHPNEPGRPDCYRLITVYHEAMGARKPGSTLPVSNAPPNVTGEATDG